MNEISQVLNDSVSTMMARHGNGPDDRDALLNAFDEAGLPLALLPENMGGVGLPLSDAAGIVRQVAAHATPLPVVELLMAPAAAARAGLDTAATTIGLMRGTSTAVPAIAGVRNALILDVAENALIELPINRDGHIFADIAGEPWRKITSEQLASGQRIALPDGEAATLARAAALLTAAASVAGMQKCLSLASEHSNERKQFGRTLSKFQAVQDRLATSSIEMRVTEAALDWTLALVDAGICKEIDWLSVKVQSAVASGLVASDTHQVLGALGFTEEFTLHRFTKRILAWRNHWGRQAELEMRIAGLVMQDEPSGLWPLIADGR